MMTTNTRFSDVVLQDKSLSMNAKGVFVSISFLGNGCTLDRLAQITKDGTHNILHALKELEQAGYILFEKTTVRIKSAAYFGSTN